MENGLKHTAVVEKESETTSNVLPYLPIEVDETHFHNGAREILAVLRPKWNTESISYTVFTAGYTNVLIGCKEHDDDEDDVILLRIYGRCTSLIIDREMERKSMVVLNAIGCSAPVYCRFVNGMAYGYQPGVTLDDVLIRRPDIQRLVADKMACLHSTDVSAVCTSLGNGILFDQKPSLFRSLHAWLEHVPDSFNDDIDKQAKLTSIGFTKQELEDEVAYLERVLKALDSPVVLCHNDLLPKNILFDDARHNVHFIDFEYVAYNYQAFDIGNHFCEYAGMGDIDFSRYPCREYQLNWLRFYLESLAKYRGLDPTEVTSEDIDKLYGHVQKFGLVSHLFWAIWALIQSKHSIINFDYLDFARLRLTEYKARKTEALLSP